MIEIALWLLTPGCQVAEVSGDLIRATGAIRLWQMIANFDTAKRVSDLMLQIGAQLNESVRIVQEGCPEAESAAYRRAVGAIMAEILLKTLNPLYSMHPTLKPPGFE